MEFIETGNFAITLTIPSFKNVYYSGQRRKYGNMKQLQQYSFLEDIIINNISKFEWIDWVYEEHDDRRLHCHLYALNTNEEIVKDFIHNFYNWNSKVGIRYSSYSKLSCYEKTKADIKYWVEYMNKNQDKIIYKSKYRQELIDIDNLDGRFHKIKASYMARIETPTPPFEWYDTPDTYSTDEYRFGKKTNFSVEF